MGIWFKGIWQAVLCCMHLLLGQLTAYRSNLKAGFRILLLVSHYKTRNWKTGYYLTSLHQISQKADWAQILAQHTNTSYLPKYQFLSKLGKNMMDVWTYGPTIRSSNISDDLKSVNTYLTATCYWCSQSADQLVNDCHLSVDDQMEMAMHGLHVLNHGIDPFCPSLRAVDSAEILYVPRPDTCHRRQFIHFHTIITLSHHMLVRSETNTTLRLT